LATVVPQLVDDRLSQGRLIRLGAGMDPATVVQAVARLAGPQEKQLSQKRGSTALHAAGTMAVLGCKVYRTGIAKPVSFVPFTRGLSLAQRQISMLA
jgi:hypothetical protein